MIDNFELIKPLFYFNEGNNMFFHCQIIQRSKDHKGKKIQKEPIKTYFIRSREHLERVKEEIILLCEHYKARAYINVAAKDFYTVNNYMLAKLAGYNYTEQLQDINPRRLLNSAVGTVDPNRKIWVIDIDDISIKEDIIRWLDNDNYNSDLRQRRCLYIRAEIPTVHGCHLIVIPFNTKAFNEAFPNVDVHKNSMGTLLYYPKSLEK